MTTRYRLTTKLARVATALVLGIPVLSLGEVLLSTDFADRTISGKTANDVLWTSNGLSAPSSLTAVDEDPTSAAFAALFDTVDAQGHFAPDKNIGNEGPWSATVTVTPTSPVVSLESIDIDWRHFNNAGSFQGATTNRNVRWTVTVTGSTSGVVGSVADSANAPVGLNTLTFSTPLILSNSETYDIEFFVDNNGNTTGNNTGFNGLTFNGEIGNEPDTTAPTVSSLNPAAEAMDVSPLANLVITFDEVVRKGTGDIVIRQSGDGAVVEIIEVTSGNVTIDGAEVTIDPTGNLPGLRAFSVQIDPGALEDPSGNAFAGIADDATWKFTTGMADTTAPEVTSLSPAHEATGVAPGTGLVITFDEDVREGAGAIVIKRFSDDAVVATADVGAGNVTFAGAEVTLRRTADLPGDTRYYVQVDPGAVEDLAGNPFAGIADKSTWNFTTAAGPSIILATDFTGRTVNDKTASGITWIATGVRDPGDLTWVLEGGGPANTALFDTAAAQGHFAPDLNIENEGPWSTTITLELTVSQILLEQVVLDWQHFNNAGAFQSVNRSADWTVSVTGSASGLLASVTASNINGISGVETLTFDSPVALNRAESYEVKIFVVGNGPGNNTGLNAVTLIGPVGPGDPFRLAVDRDGADLVFEWESRSGMLYNLKTSSDLAADFATWALVVGDIPATPPANTESIPRPGDPVRFYRVEEFPAPPVTVFEDDFESGQGAWTVGSGGEAGTEWQLGTPSVVGPTVTNSGVNCFGTNLNSEYGSDANVWLRSPAIDLTGAGGATLIYGEFKDIEVMFDSGTISVLDAADDSFIVEIASGIDGTSTQWDSVSRQLPAEALDRIIKIEFRLFSDNFENRAGWYLDDVVVTTPAP